MKWEKLREKKWYSGAVVACIGVAFYVLLTNWHACMQAVGHFIGNFKAVILGLAFAYILNPLAKLFYYRVFRKMKPGKTRWSISVVLSILIALLAVVLLVGMLIPQLVQSIMLFSESFDTYAGALKTMIEGSPVELLISAEQLDTLSQNALTSISTFVRQNAGSILSSAANTGKNVLTMGLALIVAIYLLFDKNRVLTGLTRLFRALLRQETAEKVLDFVLRCDSILVSFITQSLLDSLIVGCLNLVFMLVCRMEYAGLVSVLVAMMNLIPNFGAIIGIACGAFILLLVNPMHSLLFLVFGCILQLFDAYILKPKLFSSSLGVSGLLILVSSIVLGNIFGILGVLLAIPAAAVLSFIYHDFFLPSQEKRRGIRRDT